MRSDLPPGFNEDIVEPPCEIFLQLFIENGEMAVGEIAVGDMPINDDIYPIDQFLPNDDSESDENVAMQVLLNDDGSSHSTDFLSVHSSDSSASSVSELSWADEHHYGDSDNDSVDAWLSENCRAVSAHQPEDDSDAYVEMEHSIVASPNSTSETIENGEEECSSAEFQDFDDCEELASEDLSLSNDIPNDNESSEELEPLSDVNSLSPSTYVSLFVVVPPTNFASDEGDSLLPNLSSDRLYSGLISENPPCFPDLLSSDHGNCQSDDLPLDSSNKESCYFDELLTSDNLTLCIDSPTNSDNQNYSLSVPDSAAANLDCESSLSESEDRLTDDQDSEFSVSVANQSENTDIVVENEACSDNESCSDTSSDKSGLTLKRKLSTSDEDSVKVPKYSSSESCNDSVKVQESVDSYCKVLSCNSEKQTPSDEEKADIVPPVVAVDVIQTLGKTVEDTSVVNQKPKSR